MGRNKKTAGKTAEPTAHVSPNVEEVKLEAIQESDGFVPFEGDYEKRFYDVRLPDGEIVPNCWPNAGLMNETESHNEEESRRSWKPGECEYRPAVKDPYDRSREEEAEAEKIRLAEIELNRVRFGRLPNWKHKGWQIVLFFGRIPDPELPIGLVLGWKTFLLGVFKVKELPPEGQEITSSNIRGTILQGQVWLPFDRFGKL